MNTEEILKKVRLIEIRTRGLAKQIFSGQYHSSFKGRGMTFSEVREYQVGDDVRTIDWNVTARFNSPFIKVFEEERELTVMLIIDLSGSSLFGTQQKTKKELAIELAAVLAFSADANKDKVGAIFVTDQVEKYIAPAKGRKHILYLLRELIEFKPKSTATNLNEAFRFFGNVIKKRSIAFVLSDFVSETGMDFMQGFNQNKKRHDLVALRLHDPGENSLPDLGMIQLFNAETGVKTWVNSSSKQVKKNFEAYYLSFCETIKNEFRRNGIDHTSISTNEDYIPVLIKFFEHRK